MCDSGAVEEMQGLYGPFGINEGVVQRVWAERDYDRDRLRTLDGESVTVVHPGRWNRGAGPDFLGARLCIQNLDIQGDVEIHLREGQWQAHGHDRDPAYARVVLHVVLFPGGRSRTVTGHGDQIPVLALLPYLSVDLETLVEDFSVVSSVLGAKDPQLVWEQLAPEEIAEVLERHALRRWRQKVARAGDVIAQRGWEGACHTMALEVLGYPHYCEFFKSAAQRHPLPEWQEWARQGVGAWNLLAGDKMALPRACRPANHPRARLAQYAEWVRRSPDWPDSLAGLCPPPAGGLGLREVSRRRKEGWKAFRALADYRVHGLALGGTRLETLWADALLPLHARRYPEQAEATQAGWFCLTPGDLPDSVWHRMRSLPSDSRLKWEACNGWAQGLLGWEASKGDPMASFLGAGT